MNKNRINGTVDQLVGSVKRKAGSITNNTHLQVEGIAQQGKGKVESALGKAQDSIKSAVGDAEKQIQGHVKRGLKKISGKVESAKKKTKPLSAALRGKKT
jgi:uncharacterized protein YjbJ (UPF0337 family)